MAGEEPEFSGELALAITRLARHLTAGKLLTPGAIAILADLEQGGPARPMELACRAGVSAPTMTRQVARLEGARLIARQPDSADKRQIFLSLTNEGRLALRQGRHDPWLSARLAALSPEDLELIRQAVPALTRLYPVSLTA
jgi:DNA-binding MarR family transcriptional regulator